QRVPRPDVRAGPGHETVAHGEALRGQDVALLAVRVVQQRDPRGAVGVVLDVRDLRRHAVRVAAEVDHPVLPLVAAALVACGDPAVGVSPGPLSHRAGQRLLRLVAGDLLEVADTGPAAARCRRLVFPHGHGYGPLASKISIVSPACSVTTARFWSGRFPVMPSRERLRLPLRLIVFTESTRTFQ